MVPAGQWQAAKDTLSRPNVRSPTTSDTHGNPTTNTFYDLSRYSQYHIDMIYIVTTNPNLLDSISLQPIIHHYDLFRYSQYYTPISYLVTANTT